MPVYDCKSRVSNVVRHGLLLSFSCFLLLAFCGHVTQAQCGGDRWNVKTGLDAGAPLINLNSTFQTSIASLTALTHPATLPDNSRIAPTETTTWTLSATLIKYVRSYDSDYHIVFQDPNGRTMIGEIPDPNCVGASSAFRPGIVHARSQFDAMFTAGTNFKTASIPVVITGVGFFDYNEGQEGIAPNGVELHPIIDIKFGPTFSLSSSTTAMTVVRGDNSSVTINSSAANGFNSPVSFTATGLPAGATASFDPATVFLSSSASSTLTLSTAPDTPVGTYNVTVAGTGGGQTQNTTLTITVMSDTGGSQQIIGNPGFENGSANPAPWAATAGVIDNSGFQAPRSGAWKAWLNGFGAAHTDTLQQQTSIPSDATSAALSFWMHIDTTETTKTKANDVLKVQIRNSAGTVLATLASYSNLNAAAGYSRVVFDLIPYKGQAIQIYLIGVENGSAKTSFLVDDFSLNVELPATSNPNLSISASPSSLSLAQGTSGNYAITVGTNGGFNSAVSLTATGIPAGVSAGFSPSVVASPGSGSSVFSISPTSATPTGTYSIVITASGGGLTRTAGVSLVITAASGGGTTQQQILGNPGFENGSSNPSPWVVTSGVIDNSTYQAPHAGTWKAWLNGYGSVHTDTLYQQVSIPSAASAATLSYWLHIDSDETTTTVAYDTLKLQVRNSSGTVLANLATYSNLNRAAGFTNVSFDLLPYKGQAIQIYLLGVEDSSAKTSFVVDDFALIVTTP